MCLVQEREVCFLHRLAEVLNLGEQRCKSDLLGVQLGSFDPDESMHFVAFESHASDCHVGEVLSIFSDLFPFVEIHIVNVEREACVVLLASDLGPRSRRFAGSDI